MNYDIIVVPWLERYAFVVLIKNTTDLTEVKVCWKRRRLLHIVIHKYERDDSFPDF